MTSYKELYRHGSQINGCSGNHTNENQGYDINGKDLRRDNGIVSLSYGGDHSYVSNFSVEEQQSQINFPSRLVKCNTCSGGVRDAVMLFPLRMSLGALVEWGRWGTVIGEQGSGGTGKRAEQWWPGRGSGANCKERKGMVGRWWNWYKRNDISTCEEGRTRDTKVGEKPTNSL